MACRSPATWCWFPPAPSGWPRRARRTRQCHDRRGCHGGGHRGRAGHQLRPDCRHLRHRNSKPAPARCSRSPPAPRASRSARAGHRDLFVQNGGSVAAGTQSGGAINIGVSATGTGAVRREAIRVRRSMPTARSTLAWPATDADRPECRNRDQRRRRPSLHRRARYWRGGRRQRHDFGRGHQFAAE